MTISTPRIDRVLYDRQFAAFREFVAEKSGVPLMSFASNPYTEEQEGYKRDIYRAGRHELRFTTWKESDVGKGWIAEATINAIQVPKNNLVPWQGRFGAEARPHRPLFDAKNNDGQMREIEDCLFKLYRTEQPKESFTALVEIFGRTYPLLAYLFFLKDRSRYLPIAPTFFDRAFELLGADFKTSHRCSWENYTTFLGLIGELRSMLSESLSGGVDALDAHSFAWILSAQMRSANKLANVQDYLNLSESERDALIKARVGQGQFRQSLIDYWSSCAVTGCLEERLLRASHIKPWAQATLTERLSLYNGLLLSPALDACFDAGYVSFDEDGKILISKQLPPNDAEVLGIRPNMRLRRVEAGHRGYLEYHRANIFRS